MRKGKLCFAIMLCLIVVLVNVQVNKHSFHYPEITLNDSPLFKIELTSKISHRVYKCGVSNSDKDWFCKEMRNTSIAEIEVLAQEFFRLIIPTQPETRNLVNPISGRRYILSEAVPGFRRLPENEPHNFSNGKYKGLGQVLVSAVFLQETDLKNGNLGLNSADQVIKIDGDKCFSEVTERSLENISPFRRNYNITPRTIASLPYPIDFHVFNWLDVVNMRGYHRSSGNRQGNIVSQALSEAPQFRAEVNQALLKISLLPDKFIEKFVSSYVSLDEIKLIRLIEFRREELKRSALQNLSFKQYLDTQDAKNDVQQLEEQIESFQLNGYQAMIPARMIRELKTNMEKTFAELKQKRTDWALDKTA